MLSIKFCDLIQSGAIDYVILFRSCSFLTDPVVVFLEDASSRLFITSYLVINQGSAEAETIYGEVADLAIHGRTLCISDDDPFIWDPDWDEYMADRFINDQHPDPLPEDGNFDGY